MVIAPDSELSKVGDTVTVMYTTPITADDVTSANINTNFQSVPTHPPFITTDVLNSVLEDGATPYRTLLEKSIPNTVRVSGTLLVIGTITMVLVHTHLM